MTEGVKNYLFRLGLGRYHDMFVAKGFDSEGDLAFLDETDLDAMYIVDEADRQSILKSAPSFNTSKEYKLYEWLRSKGLDYYFISFVQSELVDIAEIGRLNLPDEQLYDELEITLPGHKRRLERAVRELSKKHKMELPRVAKSDLDVKSPINLSNHSKPDMEIPVAYGRWGKPRCLSDAKYDFLIIDATVQSTNDIRDKVDLEFMVDSGSDVVTIRQEVLDTMDLELIGPIRSKGVHASRRKNLYRANLQIGNQTLEIEVMGESYDSIGSRVIRHFRHYISGNSHIWLKGDYIGESIIMPAPPAVDTNLKLEQIVPVNKQEAEQLSVPESSPLQIQHEQMEEEENSPTEPAIAVSEVQKDFVSVKKEEVEKIIETPDTCKTEHIKVSFNFKKSDSSETKKENEAQDIDEPDKLVSENNVAGIIDVRPIIAANRKRHANENAGFDPNSLNTDNIKKLRLHNGDNTIRTINATDNNLLSSVENLNIQTVMKKRSVFYTAEVSSDSSPGS